MAAAVSGQKMIDTARRLTGTESLDPANAFCTNPELLEVLNGELAELWDVICENHDEPYFKGSSTFGLDPGVSVYPLGIDVYRILSVDVIWSADIVRNAHRFTEAERNRYHRLRPAWSQLGRVWFRPQGDNIEFLPTPIAPVNVRVNYVPSFTPMVAYTDTFNSQNQWHWFAIWGLAGYIRQKDDDEAGAAQAFGKKEATRARVISMASSRVEGEPPRVQQTRRCAEEDDDF